MARNKQPKWFEEYVPEEVANSTLFKFRVELPGGKRLSVDMRADLEVDYGIIQDELVDTPSEFAYWAAIYSELKMQVAKLERQIKVRRGKLVEKMLQQAQDAQVRVSDKQLTALIEADTDLTQLEARLMLAQKHTGKMWFMVEAIRMKADNLRSLAGFAKQEMRNP